MNCVQCLCGLLQIVVEFALRDFRFNQGWTGAFDVTDATRTRFAFVSSSPIFVSARRIPRVPPRPLPSTAPLIGLIHSRLPTSSRDFPGRAAIDNKLPVPNLT